MDIIQFNPPDKKLVRAFMDLPFQIYKDTHQWVPSLQMDERSRFDIKKYPFYKHSEAAFFLAWSGDKVIGRLAVLNNRLYNDYNQEKTAFFYLFECENDPDAASSLFEAAISWVRSQGLNKIVGPKGFTALDGFGLLVNGFEHRPAMGIPYNPPYYSMLLEGIGFTTVSESVSGYLGASMNFPDRIHELSDRIQIRRGLTVARFTNRNELKSLIPQLKNLYNGALEGIEGGTPLTDDDVKGLAAQILWFADPALIKIVQKTDPNSPGNNQMVGFLLAYPDISAALQKTRGRLYPFGWLSILRELKTTDWININGAGLIKEYQGLGGTAILFSEMQKSVVESGQFHHADIVQIGLENQKMRREMEKFGITFYKTHRIYQLNLN
jgi:hypothetical protein